MKWKFFKIILSLVTISGCLYFIKKYIIPLFVVFSWLYEPPKDCTTKRTTNPKHLQQLLETKQCPNCNLGDADLSYLNLEGVNLSGAVLVDASFYFTNLKNANLQSAQFSWYDYDAGWGTRNSCNVTLSANLQNIDLRFANLQHADLSDTDLRDSNLQDANLKGANLRSADLRGADLRGVQLQNADLQHTDLRSVQLQNADLQGAQLTGMRLPNGTYYQEGMDIRVFTQGK